MATLYEYALIADAVYAQWDSGNKSQSRLYNRGWKCPMQLKVDDSSIFGGGSLFSSGFQGRAFVAPHGKEAVIAFKGTNPRQVSDLLADAKLAMGYVPRQAKDALKHTVDWQQALGGIKTTLAGHSLGGALAQVVGSKTGLRFVTFNAPGMLRQTHGLSCTQNGLTAALSSKYESLGLNFRSGGAFAPIAALGLHIGKIEVLELADSGHSISTFIDYCWKNTNAASRKPLG